MASSTPMPEKLSDFIFLPTPLEENRLLPGEWELQDDLLVLEIGDPWRAHTPLTRELLHLEKEPRISTNHAVADVEASIAALLISVGEMREAEGLLIQSYNIHLYARGLKDPSTVRSIEVLIRFYEKWEKRETAAFYSGLLRQDR